MAAKFEKAKSGMKKKKPSASAKVGAAAADTLLNMFKKKPKGGAKFVKPKGKK